jgi:cbb3-type cytochrome c oxidase subunit III
MRILARGLGAAALVFAIPVFLAQCSGKKPSAGGGTTPIATAAAAPSPGAQGFLAYCAMCHGVSGAGDGPLAASLAAQNVRVARLDDAARLETLGAAGVRRVIVTGGGHTGRSNLMPAWGERLGRRLVDDIVAYVRTLPSQKPGVPEATVHKYLEAPPGSAEEGRKLFVFYCTGCHGPQGKGDGLNADTLRVRNNIRPRNLTDSAYFAPKTDQEIYDVIALGGGHMGKSIFMPGWTYTLKPEEIKDLASYVRVLSGTAPRP